VQEISAKLHTVAASNNRDHTLRSLYHRLFVPLIYGVVLRAHSVRGEPRIQRNANREIATIALMLDGNLERKGSSENSYAIWKNMRFTDYI